MVKDIILADSDGRELGVILDSNITVDTNGEYEFSVQIARSNWYPELTFSSYVYITDTEYHELGGNGMVTKMKQEIEELHLKQKGEQRL